MGQGEPVRARRPFHRVRPGRSAHGPLRSHDSSQPAAAHSSGLRTSTCSTTRCSRKRSARTASRASRTWDGDAPKGKSREQMNRGLALLAPTGLVNFMEVLQGGRFETEAWYRLLNLVAHRSRGGLRLAVRRASRRRAQLREARGPLEPRRLVRVVPRRHTLRLEWAVPRAHGQRQGYGRGAARRARHGARRSRQPRSSIPTSTRSLGSSSWSLGDVLESVPAAGRDRIALEHDGHRRPQPMACGAQLRHARRAGPRHRGAQRACVRGRRRRADVETCGAAENRRRPAFSVEPHIERGDSADRECRPRALGDACAHEPSSGCCSASC